MNGKSFHFHLYWSTASPLTRSLQKITGRLLGWKKMILILGGTDCQFDQRPWSPTMTFQRCRKYTRAFYQSTRSLPSHEEEFCLSILMIRFWLLKNCSGERILGKFPQVNDGARRSGSSEEAMARMERVPWDDNYNNETERIDREISRYEQDKVAIKRYKEGMRKKWVKHVLFTYSFLSKLTFKM